MIHLRVESPDSGCIVANAAFRREVVGEVGDVQTYGGDVWIEEAEVAVIGERGERVWKVLTLDA